MEIVRIDYRNYADYHKQIIELGKEFAKEAGVDSIIPLSEETLFATLIKWIQINGIYLAIASENGKVLGSICGIVGPSFFAEKTMAEELFWYVDLKRRDKRQVGQKLLDSFTHWAKDNNADYLIMASLAFNEKVMERFYKIKKYQKLETRYILKMEE